MTQPTEPPVILVIEDDPHTRAVLQVTVKQAGYICLNTETGLAGVSAAIERDPAVVLLDLGLPDIDGVEATRMIRRRSAVPIIVVTGRGQTAEKVRALDEGADDYLTKPIATEELLARVRVVLRRRRREHEEALGMRTFRAGELMVDFASRRVTMRSNEVRLTQLEYRLLEVMIRAGGRVLSNRQILREVWGPRHDDELVYLRVYMRKLRSKIETDPSRPTYLVNEPGVGYRFRLPDG